MQQHLPFTVLKPSKLDTSFTKLIVVATAPTVYGIETSTDAILPEHMQSVATAPTVYGIETIVVYALRRILYVATAPTVYGIETSCTARCFLKDLVLQQHLPFTVLKHRRRHCFFCLHQ